MLKVNASDANNRFFEVFDSALKEPVEIFHHNQKRVVIISGDLFDRTEIQIRQSYKEQLMELVNHLQIEADKNGVTRAELEEIMAVR